MDGVWRVVIYGYSLELSNNIAPVRDKEAKERFTQGNGAGYTETVNDGHLPIFMSACVQEAVHDHHAAGSLAGEPFHNCES